MKTKIIKGSLNVGEKQYTELHQKIQNETNMLMMKKTIDKFIKDNMIEGYVWHQGITIHDSFHYIITNNLTKKEYIGETNSLISRMDSYLKLNATNNKELINDMIYHGLLNFTIKIIKDDNRKNTEKELIKESIDCYNIIHNNKRVVNSSKNKEYKIGDIIFTSKEKIKQYIREELDKLNINTDIPLDSDLGVFALELVKYNKGYNEFDFTNENLKLKVVMDNYRETPGLGKWKIFCFEYDNEYWGFSTNNSIKNL